jgi:hypothetical protein
MLKPKIALAFLFFIACIDIACAGSMTLLGVGRPAPSLETFEGSSVHKIIEKVPCTLILREGENFKINAILIVGNGNDKITLTAPVISEKDQIKEIERHCP